MGQHIGEKREHQQALRGIPIQPARQQIEQHVGIEPAGGGAMRALDLIGVDLELWPRIDLGGGREQQAAK